jgi:uncharacterized protein
MSQESVDVVRSTYAAFGAGDMEAVQRLLADCEWHEMEGMPYGGVFTGPEAIFGNVFGPITQDVENFSVAPDELLDAGDRVVSLGRYSGSGSAGPVDAAFAHVWSVDDGRITKFVQYTDTRRFGDAVGK